MRSQLDALLSVQKYTAVALGDSWEVRLESDRGEIVEGTPVAQVMMVGDASSTGSAWFADVSQPMAIHLYPLPQETTTRSTIEATRVQETIQAAYRFRGVGLGYPCRVPLFDYDGVDPHVEDSDVRYEHDFLSVLNFGCSQLPDAEDRRRIRVIASFTARWRRVVPLVVTPVLEEILLEETGAS